MMRRKLKPLVILLIVCFVTLSTFTIASAAGTKKWLEAWYGLSNTTYNGQNVTTLLEPFAANETTYIPLRKVCDLFGKDIVWDEATKTVAIKDKPGESVSELKTQLLLKDSTIAALQKQVEALQDDLDDTQTIDIDDLEDELNDDFDEFEDVEFEIKLSGDEDDVTVKIEVDLDDFDDEWDDLSTREKTEYLQDICDTILDEYEDADITGYKRDSSSSSTAKLLTFETKSNGTVELDTNNLSTLEDDLYNRFVDNYDDIEMTIDLEGDTDDLAFALNVDIDEYEDEYEDYLDDDKIRQLMRDIYNYIVSLNDYKTTTVEGFVHDTDEDENIANYFKSTTGGAVFTTDL